MNSAAARAPEDESTQIEVATNDVIASCDGDLRAAIRALIVANNYLERELSDLCAAVSRGYVRGRYDALTHGAVLASGHSGEF